MVGSKYKIGYFQNVKIVKKVLHKGTPKLMFK